MKRKITHLLILAAALTGAACGEQTAPSQTGGRAEAIVAELHDPASKKVLVVSHRGDWRNWPENSIPAIESVIRMGVDIMELDLKLTKDSVLVLCHDKTIDRTTSGKGRVCDITYDSIRRCELNAGHTASLTDDLRMPTLREALEVCKDRIVVNIDQGYEYYDLALAVTEELGVTDQVLIKGKRPAEAVAAKFADLSAQHDVHAGHRHPQAAGQRELFEEYRKSEKQPLAYEVCWDEYTPEVEACMKRIADGGSKLWVNSLWSSLCGGLDDDRAFEGGPAAIYGKLIDMGATLIQTDRPELLISYLRSRGLHD